MLCPAKAQAAKKVIIYYDDFYKINVKKIISGKENIRQEENGIRATNIGTCKILTKKKNIVTITIKKAPLAVFYLAGQSNMEGVCGRYNFEPLKSVACKRGTVYSIYGYKSKERGSEATGKVITNQYTLKNATDFVPKKMTGSVSVSGKKIQYPIDSLQAEGCGKTGLDAALGYSWNKKIGEKVLIVNASYGGSSISQWTQEATLYKKACNLFRETKKLLKREKKHYTVKRTALLWMQGEADSIISRKNYIQQFDSFYRGMKREIRFDILGLIPTRYCIGDFQTIADTKIDSVRAAQYYLGESNCYKDVFLLTYKHEDFISDSYIQNYFQKYGSGNVPYPTHIPIPVPTTILDVHPDAHFTQVAHNENGFLAASNLHYIFFNKKKKEKAKLYNEDNIVVKRIKLQKNTAARFIAKFRDFVNCKKYHIIASKGFSYNQMTGMLKAKKKGRYYFVVKNKKKTILKVPVVIT